MVFWTGRFGETVAWSHQNRSSPWLHPTVRLEVVSLSTYQPCFSFVRYINALCVNSLAAWRNVLVTWRRLKSMRTNLRISYKDKWIQTISHVYGNSVKLSFFSFIDSLISWSKCWFAAKPFSYKHQTCEQERCSHTWVYIWGRASESLCFIWFNLSWKTQKHDFMQSLAHIMDASMEDLARCPGIGERKVHFSSSIIQKLHESCDIGGCLDVRIIFKP